MESNRQISRIIHLINGHHALNKMIVGPAEVQQLSDVVMPYQAQLVVTVFAVVVALGFWSYAIYVSSKDRDAVPILAMLGGGLCYFAEPIVDVLGACFIPEKGQWIAIDSFRKVPWFGVGVYMSFFGGTAFILARKIQQGIKAKQIWKLFIFVAVTEAIWEPLPIAFGIWSYYGPQPFEVLGYPLWWAPVNAVSMVLPGVLIAKVRPYLNGFSLLLVIPLVVCGDLVGNAFTAWPVWSALHMDYGYAGTYPAALLTFLLSYLAVKMMVVSVAIDGNRIELPQSQAAIHV